MKTITALIVAGCAGVVTFELQNVILTPQAHAAVFQVPTGSDWRHQMIARDPGTEGVDHSLARITRTLGLTVDQEREIRPLLQQRHDRILALLLNGPAALTLDEFMTERHRISADMHDHLDALLTDKQLQLEAELSTPRQM
jgi:signal transduction histidine kinase